MKLNKLLIAISIASFTFASCESEFTKDAELDVNVATGNGISFDGQTIQRKTELRWSFISRVTRTSSLFTAVKPEKNINTENVLQ